MWNLNLPQRGLFLCHRDITVSRLVEAGRMCRLDKVVVNARHSRYHFALPTIYNKAFGQKCIEYFYVDTATCCNLPFERIDDEQRLKDIKRYGMDYLQDVYEFRQNQVGETFLVEYP